MCQICRHTPCDTRCPNSGGTYDPPLCSVCGDIADREVGGVPYCSTCCDRAVYQDACWLDKVDYVKQDWPHYTAYLSEHYQDDLIIGRYDGLLVLEEYIQGDLSSFAEWMDYMGYAEQRPLCS